MKLEISGPLPLLQPARKPIRQSSNPAASSVLTTFMVHLTSHYKMKKYSMDNVECIVMRIIIFRISAARIGLQQNCAKLPAPRGGDAAITYALEYKYHSCTQCSNAETRPITAWPPCAGPGRELPGLPSFHLPAVVLVGALIT